MADTVTITQAGGEVVSEKSAPKITITGAGADVASTKTSPKITITGTWADVASVKTSPRIVVTQLGAELAWIVTPAPLPCIIPSMVPVSIAPRYYARLLNTAGMVVALFDDWISLAYYKEINGIYEYTLTFADNGDSRLSLFDTDFIIEVWRSVPGSGVAWYRDFVGLHRRIKRNLDSDGKKTVSSIGVGMNGLLSRTYILYNAGTLMADKSCPAETAMKEYVEENCGSSAVTANYRHANGALPGFSVDTDHAYGTLWQGSRAYKNLLSTLDDIANYAGIDFEVMYTGAGTFIFRTYNGQLGVDRTYVGLNTHTGLNSAGNVPVKLSPDMGNVQDEEYIFDRLAEHNRILVLGKGDGATKEWVVVEDASAVNDSPWNRCEAVIDASSQEFQYQRTMAGWEALVANKAVESISITPLQRPNCLYGKHYDLGDRLTVVAGSVTRNKRVIADRKTITSERETIELTFKDIP